MAAPSSSLLTSNLAALDATQPLLARRLRWAMGSDHVVRDGAGRIVLKVGVEALPLQLGGDRMIRTLRPKRVPQRVVVAGVGLGELVDAALTVWPKARVVAWDRDPWMLRLLLSRRDLSADIRAGRLQLALGADLLQVEGEGTRLIEHPILKVLYAREIAAWRQGCRGPFALMCSQALFAKDLADELRQRGLVAWSVDVQRVDPQELNHTVRQLQPVVAVVVNQVLGLPEGLHQLGLPLLTWEVDPSVDTLPTLAAPAPLSHLFTFRRRHVAELQEAGHGSVTWLPLAAPPHRRPVEVTEEERTRFGATVSFVGSSMTGRATEYGQAVVREVRAWLHATGRPPAGAQQLVGRVLALQRQDLDRWKIPELLEEVCPGLQAWCREEQRPRDPAVLLGELPSSERRIRSVAALAPFGMRVWGDGGWQVLKVPGVEYMGLAGHHHALTRIYQLSTINIDIGRLYQSDIVTMRVFDVMACGGFLLAAHSEELEALFEVGVEVESWCTRAELVAKVQHYLAHPEEARQVAERGRQAVNARHRVAHRVDQMVAASGIAVPSAGGAQSE